MTNQPLSRLHQNRNIVLLNLHAALQRFSSKTLEVFGAVYFLTQGVSFPAIALAWAASMLIRFLLRPISLWLSNRIGLKWALVWGTIFSSGLFLVFPLVHGINVWLYIFSFYLALYDIFYWLPYNAYFAVAGNEQDRGKEVAVRLALTNIIQVIVPFFGAVLATTFGFWYLYASAVIMMLLSAVPVFFAKNEKPGEEMNFKQAFKKIDRRGPIMQIGDGFLGNSHNFLWTIILFLLAGNLIGFGGLVTLELLMSTVLSFILGYFIDGGKGKWVVRLATVLLAVVILARSLWVTTIPQILLITFVAAIASTFYSMGQQVGLYNLAKRTPNTLWYHFFAEGGWDIGSAIAFLLSAALFTAGIELRYIMLISLAGLFIVNYILKNYYLNNEAE